MKTQNKPNDVNDAQWQAITHKGSHLLIIAGPGTGKTHTLTYRIVQMLDQSKENEKILAITFTKKAAEEMKGRVRKIASDKYDQLFIGTFHKFCLNFLKEHLKYEFTLVEPEEIEDLVKELWPDFSKKQRRAALDEISLWKAIKFHFEQPNQVKEYNDFLRAKALLDFDDLLVEAGKLFSSDAIKNEIQRSYRYIFVDEYQDINFAQHALLKALVQKDVLITAIGDPNQAIYGFRGSDVKFFQSFQDDFPGAKVLNLNENFRSAENLLKASAQVIGKGAFQVPELAAHIYKEGHLKIHETRTEKAEAEYVVHRIEKLIGGTSMFSQDSGRVNSEDLAECTFADIAVLYRLNSQRHALEVAFKRSGIPYQVSGDKLNTDENGVEKGVEKVNLLTIHAAKGLEFSVVFLIGCEEKLIPLNLEGMSSNIDEERRLFYVAMTRAKDVLYFTRAKRRSIFGKSTDTQISPFLHDIEESLKQFEVHTHQPSRKKLQEKQQLKFFDV